MKLCKKIISIYFVLTTQIFSQGNLTNYELGTAIYRNLTSTTFGQHWHAAVFLYFEYANTTGTLSYSQQGGGGSSGSSSGEYLSVEIKSYNIGISVSNLALLKSAFQSKFNGGATYHGAYINPNPTPTTLSYIASTANTLGNTDDIGYTWIDMIDDNGGILSEWDGTIGDIDEIRCDGIVEFSFEKNNVEVSNNDNIAVAGDSHLDSHNDLHERVALYDQGELCPRIQAGEDHGGSGTSNSTFDALISTNPTSNNFSIKQFLEYTQLNFKIGDNASVKAYVMLQVKKTSEGTWQLLIDENNNLWKFRAVDLTNWNGTSQSDNFYVPWNFKYEGGMYANGTDNYQLKITTIDQGANYSESVYDFTTYSPSTISQGQLPETGVSGGTYEINGVNVGASWNGSIYYGQTIKAISPNPDGAFYKWNDGIKDNPRTYSIPVNLYANFKGHLLSSTSVATANNNQRKMVGGGNVYHLVYTSLGEIWYTTTTDNGVTWSNEVLLSDGLGGNNSPSISWDNGIPLQVVWQKNYSDGWSKEIIHRTKNISWSSPTVVTGTLDPALEMTPVVASLPNGFIIVWKNSYNLYIKENFLNTWYAEILVPGTTENTQSPSIINFNSYAFGLCWSEGGIIFYKYFYSPISEQYIWNLTEAVSVDDGISYNAEHPTMTRDGSGRVNILWDANNSDFFEYKRIHHRRKEGNGWGNISVFGDESDSDQKDPSATGYSGVNNLSVTFQHIFEGSNTYVEVNNFNGSSWPYAGNYLGLGNQPSLASSTSSTSAKMVWRGNNTPYNIVTSSSTLPTFGGGSPGGGGKGQAKVSGEAKIPSVHSRKYQINISEISKEFAEGNISVELSSTRLLNRNGSEKNIEHSFDTIKTLNANSQRFTISNTETELGFTTQLNGKKIRIKNNIHKDGNKILASVVLRDVDTDSIVKTLWSVTLKEAVKSVKSQNIFRKNIESLKNRTVYVSLEMPVENTSSSVVYDIYHFTSDSSEGGIFKKNTVKEITPVTEYALNQNYPNPFNPTTTINYQIPKDGNVAIKIFDALGREVTTLVNEYKASGRYSVEFDASKLSSGLYFYSIKSEKYKAVKKMSLIK